MSAPEFELTASPAEQPVKVFRLDDYEWWAGYSLEGCIAEARSVTGGEYEDAEEDGWQLLTAEMDRLIYVDDTGQGRTFAAELARRIAAGEQFPQLFASTEV